MTEFVSYEETRADTLRKILLFGFEICSFGAMTLNNLLLSFNVMLTKTLYKSNVMGSIPEEVVFSLNKVFETGKIPRFFNRT